MLEQAWQYQQWLAAGLILPNIAVNLSARQLSQPTLIAKSDRILERTQMKPKYLGLEITETTMMLNFDITYNVLSQLSKRGIGILVDDFGPDYAAFNKLKNFLMKSLKIDLSLVRDLASLPSVRARNSQTHSCNPRWLKSSTIAEGMETPAQWE
ncbi:EAL domain-containing protein [Microcoleus sp. S36b_A4]|uniref:EAL domain-containing protein n=1 Tax=Microcoleus sp. S36b_A4 TaxID=3055420 RepID=UPI002FD1B298